ncbi:uncharacterized protein LOC123309618 isoform X2 [Coccinella septempunctata]|uniref:uncharacterized protein LOC123309618 isoform X2 n=1 Tax=Coccinella septempunctata TaxID=41139 RepID=UPI001D0999CB|nr:uncharacterized protein LOC123309618 isoform X2 [Coccinella septempunctata]
MVVGLRPLREKVDSKDKREICADRMNLISSNIAIKAAEEAKAAEMAQYAAACQASHRVKEQLAEKAIEAAKAAQAAAAGKAALVDEIAREKEAVKVVIMELINSKNRIEQAIEGQFRALQEDKSALKVLLAALHIAQGTTTDADTVLRGIQDDLMEKERVLQCALHRTNVLTREEECARQDMQNTKCAVRKAVQSAAEAKANAMRVKRMDEKKKP